MPDARPTQTTCRVCNNDGWYEVWGYEGDHEALLANAECPHLHDEGHPPFNATGILPESITNFEEMGDG